MAPAIRVLAINASGEEEITRIESGTASIGREPENVVVIDSTAVSRRHACFIEAGSQWVFRDLGSTNGSRLNGMRVTGERLNLVRPGDIIGIADFQMRVQDAASKPGDTQMFNREGLAASSLLIFADDRFVSEFALRRAGSTFAVGGSDGHLYLPGDLNGERQAELHLSGDRLDLVTKGTGAVPVTVNGSSVSGQSSLVDRDEVGVGHYRILVNFPDSDPELQKRQARVEKTVAEEVKEAPPIGAYDRPHLPEHLKPADGEWEQEASRRKVVNKRFVFGSNPDEENVTHTVAMSAADFASRVGFETNPSQRFSGAQFSEEEASRSKGGKLMLLLFMAIFGAALVILGILATVFF